MAIMLIGVFPTGFPLSLFEYISYLSTMSTIKDARYITLVTGNVKILFTLEETSARIRGSRSTHPSLRLGAS
jgi:hypothetical protein